MYEIGEKNLVKIFCLFGANVYFLGVDLIYPQTLISAAVTKKRTAETE